MCVDVRRRPDVEDAVRAQEDVHEAVGSDAGRSRAPNGAPVEVRATEADGVSVPVIMAVIPSPTRFAEEELRAYLRCGCLARRASRRS